MIAVERKRMKGIENKVTDKKRENHKEKVMKMEQDTTEK
jgi:hypothetical protein